MTYDASSIKDISQNRKDSIIRQLDISATYLRNLLSVYPETQNIKAPSTCSDHPTPISDQTTGIPNSDLHIYVTHFYDKNDETLAWADFCKRRNDRPIMGRIHFNDFFIPETQTNSIFEQLWDTTIHEIFHILGFDGQEIPNFHDPSTGVKYTQSALANIYNPAVTIRGLPTIVLSSPNVLQVTKNHFNCQTAAGMQFENSDGEGSVGSHWEKSIIQNEFMTANAVSSDSMLTSFSLAFLKDTNWYADVDMTMGETSPWGRGKGCDFLIQTCNASTNHQEFQSNDSVIRCTFFGHAIGLATEDSFIEGCYYQEGITETDCRTGNFDSQMGQVYGPTSMCLSYASVKTQQNQQTAQEQPVCYPMQCNSDGTQINVTVGSAIVECTTNGAVITIPDGEGLWGSITCPNIDFYCNQAPKPCSDYCNKQGYCLNATCTCLPGITGFSCSNGTFESPSNSNNNNVGASANTSLRLSIEIVYISFIIVIILLII